MGGMKMMTIDGAVGSVGTEEIAKLESSFDGKLLDAQSPAYEKERQLWNAMIDKRPGLIAQCKTEKDIVTAVNFARENDLLVAVRGGGHNIAGLGSCDDGLLVDLSQMRKVDVDAKSKTVKVQGGALLSDVDAATQKHGLALPLGINSTTGIAGLTLGGGFGWLTRKYGMTVDFLQSARVITADGKTLTASDSENPDLFWAIRGGGGNFGIVSEFTFSLVSVGPNVFAGLVVYSFETAEEVLNAYSDAIPKFTQDANVWVLLTKAPPLPFLPEEWHGKSVVVFAQMHLGEEAAAKKEIDLVTQFGKPIGVHLGMMPYVDWQQAFDALLGPGMRNYWKSHNFQKLDKKTIEVAIAGAKKLPYPRCEVIFAQVADGANKVSADSTAYPHRDIRFIMNVHGRWESENDDKACISWARTVFKELEPFASSGVYVNFMTADESDRVKSAYSKTFDRLKKIKKKYDPDNLFRVNQNISPD